jgi:phenylalanine-4-hydroxylase
MKLSPAEAKIHEQSESAHAWSERDLVQLDPDHPGFRDTGYRARRNEIARLALRYQGGEVPPVGYKYACIQYLEGAEELRLDREAVPQFVHVNAALGRATGFSLRPVSGLVGDRTFLGYLARDCFLATQYMRHPSRPLYTPEPDVVHELIGHAPTFCEPAFARLNRAFGRAAERVDAETLAQVARLYWYTLEFGVCRERGRVRAFGAGLLSSFGELGEFERRAELREFDLAAMIGTPYDPTDYQKVLFVAPSFAEMADRVCEWLDGLPGVSGG